MRLRLPADGWLPRPDQRPLWFYLQNGGTRAAIAAHRRWGKDEVALNWAAVAVHQRVGNYWHMLPQASQARKAIWEAVNPRTGKRRIDGAFPREIRATTRENDMRIEFRNGSTWQVVGSDNYDSLVGSSTIGVTFSEWALANPAAWAFVRPILAENGGWALFISTPRGRNHFHKMLDGARGDPLWFTQTLPASETGVFSPEALARERAEYVRDYGEDIGPSFYDQEYEVSFDAAVIGAYYAAAITRLERAGQVGDHVVHDPNFPVHTALDIGKGPNQAVWWFQALLGQIRVLDFWQGSQGGAERYVEQIEQRQQRFGWIRGVEYVPHDARMSEWTAKGDRTRIESLIDMGCRPVLVPDHKVDDGINAVHRMLPSTWFHERCRPGIEAIRLYRSDWDEKNRVLRPMPVHDWTSHPADGLRYLAMAYRAMEPEKPKPPDRILSVGAGNTVRLNDLYRDPIDAATRRRDRI